MTVLTAVLWLAPAVDARPDEVGAADTVVLAREALLVPGEPVKHDVALIVRNGRIMEVHYPVHSGDDLAARIDRPRVIDLRCCFVVPGLIDTQTHLQSQRDMPPRAVRLTTWTDADYALRAMVHARRTLEAGFTTIRDMGSHGDAMFALRDAIEEELVTGPRMQIAGEVVHPTGGELRAWFRPEVEEVFRTSAACNGPDDCRRAVRAQVARGSDTIKVETKRDLVPGSPTHFTLEELRAIADETHRLGVRVTASAFSAASMNLPLRAGFDAVVHGAFVDDETLELLRTTSAYYIPTLVAARTVREIADDPEAPVTPAWRAENRIIHDGMIESFRRVLDAGLPVAFGTDAGWRPHGGNAEQLVQMVELGMAPEAVIAAATLHAARVMGWSDRVGTLETGKYADLVATASSPLEDITELTRPLWVLKGGEVVSGRPDHDP